MEDKEDIAQVDYSRNKLKKKEYYHNNLVLHLCAPEVNLCVRFYYFFIWMLVELPG